MRNVTGTSLRAEISHMRRRPMNIAMGGIAVECCTFSPVLTELDDFEILRGDALHSRYPFLDHHPDATFSPLFFAQATPGGPVAADAYARLKAEFLQGLQAGGPWDGVYLDMHGAMFVEGMQDAEGDWMAAVRGGRPRLSAGDEL
ncbi:MAG: M81 family metallopeptidase [Caldilineaceae bacterium]